MNRNLRIYGILSVAVMSLSACGFVLWLVFLSLVHIVVEPLAALLGLL